VTEVFAASISSRSSLAIVKAAFQGAFTLLTQATSGSYCSSIACAPVTTACQHVCTQQGTAACSITLKGQCFRCLAPLECTKTQHKDRCQQCTAHFCQNQNSTRVTQASGCPQRHQDNMLPVVYDKSECTIATVGLSYVSSHVSYEVWTVATEPLQDASIHACSKYVVPLPTPPQRCGGILNAVLRLPWC
jgi:hypothetical protein